MSEVSEFLRLVHVAAGAVGLVAFWIPVFSRKGARNHVRYGKVFVRAAYVVLGAAAVALVLRLFDLQARNLTPADAPEMYTLIVFLGYLTFVTFVIVRHGMAVLRHKGQPQALRTPLNVVLAWGCVAASAAVIAYAVAVQPSSAIVLYALSPIGIATGLGNLRYFRTAMPSPRAWWYEHLGAMLGAGIAFHTAFAVFGVTRLFDTGLDGWLAIVPWVAPTIIGVPAIALWTRHYRRKFSRAPARLGEPA
ncbi:MAG TPA: hypothetical protein VHG33_01490 [Woeseiaceae bacterium]|nr:hypothetical protein [Woeseiaceae bacterium]